MDLVRNCGIILLLCIKVDNVDAQSDAALPIIKKFTTRSDLSGIMTSTVRYERASFTMVCSAHSESQPMSITISRQRDGTTLKEGEGSELSYKFDSLICIDTGVYVCIALNNYGNSSARMDLTVLCPPQLLKAHNIDDPDSPLYYSSVGSDLAFHLDILSSPPPTKLILTTANSKKVVAIKEQVEEREHGDFGALDENATQFELEYVPGVRPLGTVQLVMNRLKAEELDKIYSLVVENERTERLIYVFMLVDSSTVTEANTMWSATPTSLPPASYWKVAVSLGVALLTVVGVIVLVTVFIACRKCLGQGGCVKTMMDEREVARSQWKILRHEKPRPSENTVPQPVSMASELRVLDNNALTHDENIVPANQDSEQHELQNLSQSQRFKDDYETVSENDKSSSHSQKTSMEGIENVYYVSEADLGEGAKEGDYSIEDDDERISIYAEMPRNTSVVPKDSTGVSKESKSSERLRSKVVKESTTKVDKSKKKSKKDSTDVRSTSCQNSTNRFSKLVHELYATVVKSKKTSNKKPVIGVTAPATRPDDTAESDILPGELYANAPSTPEKAMHAAEQKIANGSSGTEFVVLGPHRKLSLPKEDLEIYQNF